MSIATTPPPAKTKSGTLVSVSVCLPYRFVGLSSLPVCLSVFLTGLSVVRSASLPVCLDDDVGLHVLGCRVDILGTNCNICLDPACLFIFLSIGWSLFACEWVGLCVGWRGGWDGCVCVCVCVCVCGVCVCVCVCVKVLQYRTTFFSYTLVLHLRVYIVTSEDIAK